MRRSSSSTAGAVKLEPSLYPKWTGVIAGLPADADVPWKCLVRRDRAQTASR